MTSRVKSSLPKVQHYAEVTRAFLTEAVLGSLTINFCGHTTTLQALFNSTLNGTMRFFKMPHWVKSKLRSISVRKENESLLSYLVPFVRMGL
jgi:hypothetical protein